MGMASRALSPLLPTSWFRRRRNAPSSDPLEAPLDTPYKRLIAELRPPRGQRSPVPPDPSEALAYEAEKRQWIDEQKRLIAEAMRRSGGPDPRWNANDRGGKDDRRQVKVRRTPVIEELSAYEIKKRRWMAEHQRSIARERQLSRFQAFLCDLQATETASDPAKRPCVDDERSGGGLDRVSERWLAKRDEERKRRRMYLRNYCPFQSEEESVPEEEEERKRTEPDNAAEIERSVPVVPADGPGPVDGEFVMKSDIEKNPWGARRHSEEYYARRREVLQSFKIVVDKSEKAAISGAPRSACATTEEPDDAKAERPEEETVPEEEKKPEPDDAEIERTVPVLPSNGPEPVDVLKLKSVIEKNLWGGRRHSEEYYARRRQVLQRFKVGMDQSEEAGVDAARRSASACATTRRNAIMSVLGFARVPAAAKTCCTADAVDVVDRS